MMKKPNSERTMLRMPSAVKAWLEARAVENERSLTGELVVILKATMRADTASPKSKAEKCKESV